jgi:hypothetical protein
LCDRVTELCDRATEFQFHPAEIQFRRPALEFLVPDLPARAAESACRPAAWLAREPVFRPAPGALTCRDGAFSTTFVQSPERAVYSRCMSEESGEEVEREVERITGLSGVLSWATSSANGSV